MKPFRIAPELCPKPWVRKLPDYIAPANPNRWQSYIPDAPSQFDTHASQAAACDRIRMWELTEQLRAELRGQIYGKRAA